MLCIGDSFSVYNLFLTPGTGLCSVNGRFVYKMGFDGEDHLYDVTTHEVCLISIHTDDGVCPLVLMT